MIQTVSIDMEEGFSVLPPGKYPATVLSCTYVDAKDRQSKNWLWEFQIADGEHQGQTLKMWNSMKPQSRFRLTSALSAFIPNIGGTKLEIQVDEETGIIVKPDLRNRPCILAVSDEMNGDQKVNRIDSVLPAGSMAQTQSMPGSTASVPIQPAVGAKPPITIGGRKLS